MQCIISCLLKFIGEACPGCLHSSGSNYRNNQLTHVRQKPFVFIMKGKTDLLKIFSLVYDGTRTLYVDYLEITMGIGGAFLKKTGYFQ